MKDKSSRGGSFLGLLFLVFLILKLTGVIDWSWWWVTSPLWLPVALVLGGLVLAGVFGLVIYKIVSGSRRETSARRGSGEKGPKRETSVVVDAPGSEVAVTQTPGPAGPGTAVSSPAESGGERSAGTDHPAG